MGNTKSVAIYSGNTADVKTMRIGPWVKDNLLLFDLGYFKYELFRRISENDGYFVSRMKSSANPYIVSVLRTHRGNTIDLAGKKLKDVLSRLKREVIDVEIEVSFKDTSKKKSDGDQFDVYQPKGTSKVKDNLRLVGVLDEESQTYHLYLTNLSPDQLSAEDVALLYRARWSIELIFKELKSLYQLDVISSGARDVVETLVLVAMLTLVVSHKILNFVRSCAPPEERLRYTSLRWAELFYSTAFILMAGVLDLAGVKEDPFLLLCYYMEEGIDPNVNRERLLTPWISTDNSQLLNGCYRNICLNRSRMILLYTT
jgi:IS4 transposase